MAAGAEKAPGKKNPVKVRRGRKDYEVATNAFTLGRFTTAAQALTAAGLGDYRVTPGTESKDAPTAIVNAPDFDQLVRVVRKGVRIAQAQTRATEGDTFDSAYKVELATLAGELVVFQKEAATRTAATPTATDSPRPTK